MKLRAPSGQVYSEAKSPSRIKEVLHSRDQYGCSCVHKASNEVVIVSILSAKGREVARHEMANTILIYFESSVIALDDLHYSCALVFDQIRKFHIKLIKVALTEKMKDARMVRST